MKSQRYSSAIFQNFNYKSFFKQFVFFVLIFISNKNMAQCPPGNVILSSQADVINFFNAYPTCTTINGNMAISGADITTLTPYLDNITSVTGDFDLHNNLLLPSFNGLHNLNNVGGDFDIRNNALISDFLAFSSLQTVGGNLRIYDHTGFIITVDFPALQTIGGSLDIRENSNLFDISGFANLQTIGSFLYINDNDALGNFSGFGALTSVNGNFDIRDNAMLSSISGFASLQTINYNFRLYDNPILATIPSFAALTTLGGEMDIRNNDALTGLSGFNNIPSIGGYTFISDNDGLTSITGFSSVTSIGDYLDIRHNDVLTDISGFAALNSLVGQLLLFNNTLLPSLDGLFGLTTLGGNIELHTNPALTDISALNSVTDINGELRIFNNDALKCLDGLNNIDYTKITNLEISGNAQLSACSVQSICDYLSNSGTANVHSNDGGCSSTTEINNNCNLASPKRCLWQGGNGDWDFACNWSCGRVPMTIDTAVISSPNEPQINSATSAGVVIMNIGGASIGGTGSLNITDEFDWSRGDVNLPLTMKSGSELHLASPDPSLQYLNDDLIIESGATVNHQNTFTFLFADGVTITNHGQYNFMNGSINLLNGAVFDNHGDFDASFDGNINNACSSDFNNYGTVIKSAGTGNLTFDSHFDNQGDLEIYDGDIQFDCDFTNSGFFGNLSSGLTYFENPFTNTGFLFGLGTVTFNSSFDNDGTIDPGLSPGVLTLNKLTNTNGEIEIEIESNAPANAGGHDSLSITGPAILGGDLNISLLNGFNPLPGESFIIMTCANNDCIPPNPFSAVNFPPGAWFINYGGTFIEVGILPTLPVELIDFQAFKHQKNIQLTWKTASEKNNRGFEIQKSADGLDWKKIGWVNGHGNSDEKNTYLFLDKNPDGGMNYYRLRQMDFDGKFEFSKIVNVMFEKNQQDIHIFPNPANDVLQIQAPQHFNFQKITIYNHLGKAILIEENDFPKSISPISKVEFTGWNSRHSAAK